MKHVKIVNVVGARPNFIKMASILEAQRNYPFIEPILVHTGQHYDLEMSDQFFKELEIPEPDINLGVGSSSHAVQTAEVMVLFEKVLLKEKPEIVIVVGDVNSTFACALTATKLQIPVAHVEAGLRSFDRTMPEEINRILTDAIADFLFTSEKDANENLKREGIPNEKIHFVGNVMIDTLLKHLKKARCIPSLFNLPERSYGILTLHRPGNVDKKRNLHEILEAIQEVSRKLPILFPCHPRTRHQISRWGLMPFFNDISMILQGFPLEGIYLCRPLGYLSFLGLMDRSRIVLTDSGGIQEETTILGIPCVTLRENTERPVTVFEGTNIIAGTRHEKIIEAVRSALEGTRQLRKPMQWDGKAAERIVKILVEKLG